MTTTEPVTRVDLTAPSASLSYAEILTPAGLVRVNTGLVDTRTGRPVVTVEVERQIPPRPNTRFSGAHTAPSGEWSYEVRENLGMRVDVVLTRLEDPADTGQSPLPATRGGRPIDARENRP